MVALFLAWPWLTRLHGALEKLSGELLAHLGLLFVPAGVGVMLHLGLLTAWWMPLLAALVISTSATMALSAWLFVRLRRRRGDEA